MARFEVTGPDGSRYEVNAPDDASNDQIMQYVQSQARPNADKALGGTLQLGIPFTGKRFDTGIGLSPDMEASIVGAGKTTARFLQGVNPFTDKAQVEEENRLYKPLAEAHPKSTMAGEIFPYLAATSLPAMVALSAAEYGTPAERAERAGASYVGGKAVQGLARLFGPKSMSQVGSKGAEDFVNLSASQGNKFNIPLRTAQTTESRPVQMIDAVASNLPISSGVIAKAKDASYQAFNREVSHTFGADSTKITPELLGEYKQSIGRTIGKVAERNAMNLDPAFAQDIARIGQRLQNELTQQEAELVNKQITQIVSKIDPETGKMPGGVYKAYDALLGKLAKDGRGTIKDVLGDLRNSMRDAMDRSISKEDAAIWKKARREYFNLQQVATATKATPGELSPTQLLQAVNNAQKNARFGAGNDLAELAQFAKPTLGDKIPTSGTAERLWYQKLLTNPLTTLGSVGGGLYGANELGVDPKDAALGLLAPYLAARGMAGKPASEFAKRMMAQGGGLLGLSFAP